MTDEETKKGCAVILLIIWVIVGILFVVEYFSRLNKRITKLEQQIELLRTK